MVYDVENSIYNNAGINFSSLMHLESIGLINFSELGYLQKGNFKVLRIYYYGETFIIEFETEQENSLEVGKVLLTQTGEQLAKICNSKPVDGFINYVIENWVKEKNLKVWSPLPRIEN